MLVKWTPRGSAVSDYIIRNPRYRSCHTNCICCGPYNDNLYIFSCHVTWSFSQCPAIFLEPTPITLILQCLHRQLLLLTRNAWACATKRPNPLINQHSNQTAFYFCDMRICIPYYSMHMYLYICPYVSVHRNILPKFHGMYTKVYMSIIP